MLDVGVLGEGWFHPTQRVEIIDLLIHEFGHDSEGNHLLSKYHDALTRLGAKATVLAHTKPEVFDLTKR